MNLIYIGDMFYSKSSSSMSPIYEILSDGTLKRSDWGFVNIALQSGEDVHIRQANDSEMKWAYSKLGKILSKGVFDE